jgi:hypothetical protein
MHAVVRSYSGKGAKGLFDVLEKNKADVEKTIRSVKGFVNYTFGPQRRRRIFGDRLQGQSRHG